jgi:hypothetical protein
MCRTDSAAARSSGKFIHLMVNLRLPSYGKRSCAVIFRYVAMFRTEFLPASSGKKVINSNIMVEGSTQMCLCGRVGGTEGG